MGGLKASMILSSGLVDADSQYDKMACSILPTLQAELDKDRNKRPTTGIRGTYKVGLEAVSSVEQFKVNSIDYYHLLSDIPSQRKCAWQRRAKFANHKKRNIYCPKAALQCLRSYVCSISKRLDEKKSLKVLVCALYS